ncbi:MAG: hypothetical protein KAI73_05860, partial [Rhodospirillaceae bacterium]|nr:hypothetical protein [Rhodospirillaceae bacterium]
DGVEGGFDQVKSELRDLGAKIIPIAMPELDLNKLRRAAFLIIESEGAVALAEPLSSSPGSFSDALKAMFAYGRNAPETKIDDARHYLETIKMAISQVFAEVDFILSPTAPQTAFAFDGPIPNNQADLTALANISGYPAITLPSGLDASGLPLAIQLMASSYRESELLGTAMVLEGLWGTISPPLTTRT